MAKETADMSKTDLEERAFDIYRDLAGANRMRHKTPRAMAEEAFQLAEAFNETLADVRSGKVSTKTVEAPRPKMITIPRMHAKSDSTPVIFEQTLDPKTKKPIFDDILQDQGAFCPNAPLSHPANARFAPLDGRTPEEHILEARTQLALAN